MPNDPRMGRNNNADLKNNLVCEFLIKNILILFRLYGCRKTVLNYDWFTGSCSNFGMNLGVCFTTDLQWMMVPQLNRLD